MCDREAHVAIVLEVLGVRSAAEVTADAADDKALGRNRWPTVAVCIHIYM